MKFNTLLITGANGYIGKNLSKILMERFSQIKVFGLDIAGKNENIANDNSFIADIANKNAISRIIYLTKPDCIFHLAGIINSNNWDELYSGNVYKTKIFLDVIEKSKLSSKIIIPGSAAEYGEVSGVDLPITEKHLPNPLTPYGLSKVFQTTIARYYSSIGLNIVVGRIFNFIGKGMPDYMAIGNFAKQISNFKKGNSIRNTLHVGNIDTKRDFLDIEDMCNGLIDIALKGRKGEIYNICSGKSISMKEILNIMIEVNNLKVKVNSNSKNYKKVDINDIYGSNKKIRLETKWSQKLSIINSMKNIFDE